MWTSGQWSLLQELTASDADANDRMGRSIAIEGDTIVVGALHDDENGPQAGAAYVFEPDVTGTWVQTQKLTASDGESGDSFGISVAISNGRIVVGAYGDDDDANGAGAAYVFEHDGTDWTQTDKLTAGSGIGGAGDWFGVSVAIDEDTILVGAARDDLYGLNDVGSAYVFEHDGTSWDSGVKLTLDQSAVDKSDQFGFAVSVWGDRAVVGVHKDDDQGTNSGAMYVFERSAGVWGTPTKLFADDGEAGDEFGYSVAIEADRLLAGARYDDDQGTDAGANYIYEHDGSEWGLQEKIVAADGAPDDNAGYSVALESSRIITGVVYHDTSGSNDAGAAYIDDLDSATVTVNVTPIDDPPKIAKLIEAKDPLVSGDVAVLQAVGVTDDGAVDFVRYYWDKNGDGQLDTQVDEEVAATTAAEGFTAHLSLSEYPWGPQTFLAQAVDDQGMTSTPLSKVVESTLSVQSPLNADIEIQESLPESKIVFIAEGRIGDNSESPGNHEIDLTRNTGSPDVKREHQWTSGQEETFRLTVDGDGSAEFEIAGNTLPYDFTGEFNTLQIRTRATKPDTSMTVMGLTLDGQTIDYTSNASPSHDRGNILIRAPHLISDGFILEGTVIFTWGATLPTNSNLAFQIKGGYTQDPPPTPVRCIPCEEALSGQSNPGNTGGSGASGSGGSGGPGSGTDPHSTQAGVRPFDGAVGVQSPSLHSGGFGVPWGQSTAWTNYSDLASGHSGEGMAVGQMPKLIQRGDNTLIAASGSTARYFDDNADTFESRFFLQDTIERDAGNKQYVERDTLGNTIVYHDFDPTLPVPQQGTFKRHVDPAGNVTEVTDWTIDGRPQKITRTDTTGGTSTTEQYEYTYVQSGKNEGRLESVTLSRDVGAGFQPVRSIEYTYYANDSESYGNAGDVKYAVLKDENGGVIDTTYYRYYKTNQSGGFKHGLKYIFHPQSYDRLVAAVGDPESASDAAVAPYADAHYKYDDCRRVVEAVVQGAGCSSCSAGLGTFSYSYDESTHPDGYNNWKFKTTETLPDGNHNIYFSNFAGQVMLEVFVEDGPAGSGQEWLTFNQFDGDGRVILSANPSAVSGYDQAQPDLLNGGGGNYQYLRDNAGLIFTTDYYTTTTATATVAGGVAGYYQGLSLQQGELGTPKPQHATDYVSQTAGGTTVFFTASDTVYRNEDGTGQQTTTFDYTFFPGTTQIESVTTTLPLVSAAQNGPGTPDVSTMYFDVYARPTWTRDADGFLTYTEYDQGTGRAVKMIADVDTTQTADFFGLPSGWSTPAGGGLHLVTAMEIDGVGRETRMTDPNGNVTYTVYKDVEHEVRIYVGWDAATETATLPTRISREDRPGSFIETIVTSATPNVESGRPTGDEAITIDDVENLSRSYTNESGQTTHVDAYFSLVGMIDPSDTGTEGVNFLRTSYQYDDRGRQNRIEDPTGTIQRTVYDGLSRPVSAWIGTDDAGFSPSSPGGMLQVSETIYDNGGVGDGNVTRSDTIFGDGPTDRYTTEFEYDFRNRRTGTRGPDAVAVDTVFDNLGQATQQNTYADLDLDFDLDANELRARSETLFDDQQRPYQTSSYEVDQTDGTLGNRLTSNVWYNHRGLQVKTEGPSGLFSKTLYDGAGRGAISLTSIDDETTWSDALDATGDTVIVQSETIYDPGSRVVAVLTFQRESTSLLPEGTLDGSNSYRNASVTWYDRANRVTHYATFGRDEGPVYYVFDAAGQIMDCDANGIPDEAESTPREPNQSPDWIASRTEYDAAGRAFRTTDNLGRVMHADFDLLNRTVRVIENYVDGVVTETETDTDQTVEYDFDAAGRMTTLRAKNPKGSGNGVEDQETVYLFKSDINASWTTNVIYPDSADTDSSGTDQVKSEYDRLGRYIRGTDQRGVEHTITFDEAGRLQSDAVTNLGPSGNVDDSVIRIERSYDDVSRVATITSYDAATDGNVVNQVAYQYNGYGLASVVRQDHDGSVNASTPEVRYNYDDGATAGEARYVRLSSVEYPGGRQVFYLYPASGIGDALNRVEAIADDAGLGGALGAGLPTPPYLAEYSYLGAGTIVAVEHPAVSGGLTLDYNATGNYEGWDRFGRVVNQEWTNGAGITTLDHYTYTYDFNSNRTSRVNALNSALSESYTYDALDRLVDVNRAGSDFQSWNLDSLGNWDAFDDQGSTESREHNAANELTSIAGGINPTFDAAGNMTSGPKPDSPADRQHYQYDAWKRLVRVSADDGSENPGTTTAEFEYDGRNYRVQKTAGGVLQAFFYNEGHQVVEVRENGNANPSEEYVWDLRYIDAPVVRFHDANTDGTLDDTLYYANDANMNITALIDATTGDVVERYHYDPYGRVQIYDGVWTARASSAFDNAYLYTGRRFDSETGLFYFRSRYYDSSMGRFIGRDRAGYSAGPNLYRYVSNGPLNAVDPYGYSEWKLFRYGKDQPPQYGKDTTKWKINWATQGWGANAKGFAHLEVWAYIFDDGDANFASIHSGGWGLGYWFYTSLNTLLGIFDTMYEDYSTPDPNGGVPHEAEFKCQKDGSIMKVSDNYRGNTDNQLFDVSSGFTEHYKKSAQPTINNADNVVYGRVWAELNVKVSESFEWSFDLTVDFGKVEATFGASSGLALGGKSFKNEFPYGFECRCVE